MQRASSRTVLLSALLAGGLFGFGLSLSTMVQPESILQFLLLNNMGLLLVLGGAAGVTAIAYALLPRLMKRPLFGHVFHTHPSHLNAPTLIGAAIFGIGWGLAGVCPGPAIAGLGVGNWPLLLSVLGILLGAGLHGRFFGKHEDRPHD
jgi:uncharacterized membrane protein YedE/YeeE